jgi:hypothetical protein
MRISRSSGDSERDAEGDRGSAEDALYAGLGMSMFFTLKSTPAVAISE